MKNILFILLFPFSLLSQTVVKPATTAYVNGKDTVCYHYTYDNHISGTTLIYCPDGCCNYVSFKCVKCFSHVSIKECELQSHIIHYNVSAIDPQRQTLTYQVDTPFSRLLLTPLIDGTNSLGVYRIEKNDSLPSEILRLVKLVESQDLLIKQYENQRYSFERELKATHQLIKNQKKLIEQYEKQLGIRPKKVIVKKN